MQTLKSNHNSDHRIDFDLFYPSVVGSLLCAVIERLYDLGMRQIWRAADRLLFKFVLRVAFAIFRAYLEIDSRDVMLSSYVTNALISIPWVFAFLFGQFWLMPTTNIARKMNSQVSRMQQGAKKILLSNGISIKRPDPDPPQPSDRALGSLLHCCRGIFVF
jgi:hypothetical protein